MQNKKVLITGVTGQAGALLSKYLLDSGIYRIFGGVRRVSVRNTGRLEFLGILNKIKLVPFELLEYENIKRQLEEIQPDFIVNFAAQSFVHRSFIEPMYTNEVTGVGTLRILEAMRSLNLSCRYYQSSSSEMYGDVLESPQTETTPFNPMSPYAVSKCFSHQLSVLYRKSYHMFNANGILFNFEGPLRGQEFVTRKITYAVAEFSQGRTEPLKLGNLSAKRDWNDAEDSVRGIWQILNHDVPDDFVIATGIVHTVREFVESAFAVTGKQIIWEGESENEVGRDLSTGQVLVMVDKEFFRPSEVNLLVGDASKARKVLGWNPQVTFQQLVEKMVVSDLEFVKKGRVY